MTEKRIDKNFGGVLDTLSKFHLEANRCGKGMSIILSGIIGISDFSDSLIELKSHGGRICVTGKRLFINVYQNNSVEIVGKIEEICFRNGRN